MRKLFALVICLAMAIGFAIVTDAAVGTVVYGYKVEKAPNIEEIDESWGEPAIYVTKDSPNAQSYKFWDEYEDTAGYRHGGTGPNGRTTIQPEPSDFWLYVCYTNKYLYIGIKSPDVEFSGSETVHRGDGVHMWLEPMDAVEDPTSSNGAAPGASDEKKSALSSLYSYYWNVAFDDYSVDKMFACLSLDENPVIYWDEEYMHAILEIPLANYGLRNKDLHGFEFAISVRRVSSKSYYDEGYAGWLQWGAGMKNYTPIPNSLNTIVLIDPAQGELVVEPDIIETQIVETEPIVINPEEETGPAAQIGDVIYDTFTAAVAAVQEGETIILLRNTRTEADVVVNKAMWFLVDGMGFGYPDLVPGEGLTRRASGSPFNEYLGAYYFEGTPVETDPIAEAPATEAPATEAPATEAPATEAPATEAPATEAPATEAPATEAPATEAPATEAPATEAPATEAPATEAPATEAPATEAPATEAPATEAPATEAPATEAPATEAPATEAPATEAPKAEEPAPAEKSNTGLIIAIVAVVVVVGAGLGIVLGKKKK